VAQHDEPKVAPAPLPKPTPTPLPVPGTDRSEFRDRMMAAAKGAGRDAFLAQIKAGADRSRWISAIRSSDPAERGAAVTIASVARDAAVAPDLAAAGAKGDERAIQVLGEIGGARSVAYLSSLAGLQKHRPAVEAALAATGSQEAAETLAAIGSWDNQAAWQKLGAAAEPAILSRLKDRETRSAAMRAAGWAKTRAAVPELAKLLQRSETRVEARDALVAIGGPQAAAALVAAWSVNDDAMLKVLKAVPGARDAAERRMLDVRLSQADRALAVTLLVQLGDGEAEAALLVALQAPAVRLEAAWALGELKREAAVPALSDMLKDRRSRPVVVSALEKIGSPKALPALLAVADDRAVRDDVSRAVAKIGTPEAVPFLVNVLGDEDVTEVAIQALGRIKDLRAVPALIGLLESGYADLAHAALKSITGQALPKRASDWAKWWKANSKSRFDLLW
jgi:HEAT repeat protein